MLGALHVRPRECQFDAFADRLLQTPVREQGSGLGPAGHSHVHFTMLTMLKVLDGRAVERETVDAALNRLAAKPPAGPGQPRPPQWLAGQITPLFLAMTRRRPGERQQAAVASRKTACRASL